MQILIIHFIASMQDETIELLLSVVCCPLFVIIDHEILRNLGAIIYFRVPKAQMSKSKRLKPQRTINN